MADGILIIDKPAGVTSRHVDNVIQHLFNTRKVGHLGTLDPFATGVLVLGVNKGTKYLSYLGDEKKTYLARLELGVSSSSGDSEGELSEPVPFTLPSEKEIVEVLNSFFGVGEQIPPMASAKSVNGKRLYKLFRENVEIERKPSKIEIYSIQLLQLGEKSLDFSVSVSAGTYIRTLGEDIAKKLGTVGYLSSLRRLAVGTIGLNEATPLEEITLSSLKDPVDYIHNLKHKWLDKATTQKAISGQVLDIKDDVGEKVLLCDEDGKGIAIYAKESDGLYHCVRGLF